MPMRLGDRQLSSLYAALENRRGGKIGEKQVLELLASVGDRGGLSAEKLLGQLKRKGITRDEQVSLVKDGLSQGEKADLAKILDEGKVAVEAGARAFIEAVLEREAPTTGADDLQIIGSQRQGLKGTAKPNATIEAINLSAAPGGRLHLDDTVAIAKTDRKGNFTSAHLTGEQKIKQGDLVQMRARYDDGSTSDWVTIKASGLGAKDSRNAVVALSRIGLESAGGDKVSLTNINSSRPVSEPGAVLQFTNLRTKEKTQVTITATGGFPEGFTLKGKAGDSFAVAASDGANNTRFSEVAGNVTVPGGAQDDRDLVKDPGLHKDELNPDGTPKFGKARFTGPLFSDGVVATDAKQGFLGDCFFPAAMAALAHAQPRAIQELIKDNGDGTYTVHFKQRDWATGRVKEVPITVDGDLYVRSSGEPLYGAAGNSGDPKTAELWFPLVEKAYAQWKGSYHEIGEGGVASDVFEEVLGKEGQYQNVTARSAERVWSVITKATDAGQPIAAGTHGDDKEALYTNTGVFADHAYSIIGYEKSGNERLIILRNPWGESEPAGNGADDGVFKLKVEDFVKLYGTLMYTLP